MPVPARNLACSLRDAGATVVATDRPKEMAPLRARVAARGADQLAGRAVLARLARVRDPGRVAVLRGLAGACVRSDI